MPSPVRSFFIGMLALLIVGIAGALDFYVIRSILEHGGQDTNNALLGTIITAWNGTALGTVIAFFYGRSSDSDRKTELLAHSSPAQTTTATTADATLTSTPSIPSGTNP